MRHVPLAEFQDNVSAFVAAAEAGEDIVITREGREVAKLSACDGDGKDRQRAAVEAAYALGQQIKAKHGPTTAAEIREWLEEGRR